MKKAFVTVAPPTPNGDLHLGHLSGPYIASDVVARALRANGSEVHFICGSDDNQSYVPMKGKKLGLSAEAVASRYRASIEATLSRARIETDYFLRPLKTPAYVAFVQEFFKRLVESGKLRREKSDVHYCETCSRYLYEAHIRGSCPACGNVTNGNGCEKCGHYNDCTDLGDPRCNHCDQPAGKHEVERFRFPLADYEQELRTFYSTVEMSAHLRALTDEMLTRGLPDVTGSHIADWGIPVKLPGFEGQIIYDWLEMAAGYLFVAREVAGTWESLWRSADAAVVQCFGFDNGFFYTAFIPALLKAYDPDINLPVALLTNEFYRLDGLKFSTSRNHAIWGDQALDLVSADVVRFHLALTRPENEQTNFTVSDFRWSTREILAGEWEKWLESLDARRKRGPSPAETPPEAILTLEREILDHYRVESFSMVKAAQGLCRLVREATLLRDLTLELGAAQSLARATAPLMPEFSARVLHSVSSGESLADGSFARAADALEKL